VVAQSISRYGLLTSFHWSAQNNLVCEQRNQFPDIGVILVSSIRQFNFFIYPFNRPRFAEAIEKSCRVYSM
jgi:hypothetical protein